MTQKPQLTQMNVLYNDNRLADMMETLDQLHTAASEGHLELTTTMNRRELVALLRDVIYTAQETIGEIEKDTIRPEVVLQLVKKPIVGKRQA